MDDGTRLNENHIIAYIKTKKVKTKGWPTEQTIKIPWIVTKDIVHYSNELQSFLTQL